MSYGKVSFGEMSGYQERQLRKLYRRRCRFPGRHCFSGIIIYIEEARSEKDALLIFKLADLASMYTSRLQQFGYRVNLQDRVHTTRLKERILAMVPDLQTHKQGCDILLTYRDDVGKAFKKAHQECCDDEAMHLARAANIVRKAMFKVNNSFNGSFSQDCQVNSVPALLLSIVNMILYGPNMKNQSECSKTSQAASSIAQLLEFNGQVRHAIDLSPFE